MEVCSVYTHRYKPWNLILIKKLEFIALEKKYFPLLNRIRRISSSFLFLSIISSGSGKADLVVHRSPGMVSRDHRWLNRRLRCVEPATTAKCGRLAKQPKIKTFIQRGDIFISPLKNQAAKKSSLIKWKRVITISLFRSCVLIFLICVGLPCT